MAKQPETIDRIQIIAEGPLALVGAGLAALTKLGYENVGYKLITEVHRYKKNRKPRAEAAAPKKRKKRTGGKQKKFAVPNAELIAKAIKGRKQITTRELASLFTEKKRNPKSVSPIVSKMVAAKQLKSISPGTYAVNGSGATHG